MIAAATTPVLNTNHYREETQGEETQGEETQVSYTYHPS